MAGAIAVSRFTPCRAVGFCVPSGRRRGRIELLDMKSGRKSTDESKRLDHRWFSDFVPDGGLMMNALRREAALAGLQARQRQLQRELARLERQIVQAERRMLAAEKEVANLTPNPRRAA